MSESEKVVLTSRDVGTVNVADLVKPRRPRASLSDFIKAYQTSKSYEEVARKLGMTAISVQARTVRERKRGVHLKRFERQGGGCRITQADIDAANALIAELAQNGNVLV